MSHQSDQASALLAMNDQLRKMTAQLGQMVVSSAAVVKTFEQLSDVGQKVVHAHFLLDSLARGRGGFGGALGGFGGAGGGYGYGGGGGGGGGGGYGGPGGGGYGYGRGGGGFGPAGVGSSGGPGFYAYKQGPRGPWSAAQVWPDYDVHQVWPDGTPADPSGLGYTPYAALGVSPIIAGGPTSQATLRGVADRRRAPFRGRIGDRLLYPGLPHGHVPVTDGTGPGWSHPIVPYGQPGGALVPVAGGRGLVPYTGGPPAVVPFATAWSRSNADAAAVTWSSARAGERAAGRSGNFSSSIFSSDGLLEASKKTLIGGAVAASSGAPDAFETLAGSFKLLAAQIGVTLMPTLAKFSAVLQDGARAVGEMSPDAKGHIGRLAGGALALGAGVVAGRSLGVGTAMAFARAHPVGAVAATVGALLLAEQAVRPEEGGRWRATKLTDNPWVPLNMPLSGGFADRQNAAERDQASRDRGSDEYQGLVDPSGLKGLGSAGMTPDQRTQRLKELREDEKRLTLTAEQWERKHGGWESALSTLTGGLLTPNPLKMRNEAVDKRAEVRATIVELDAQTKYSEALQLPEGAEKKAKLDELQKSLPGFQGLQDKRDNAMRKAMPYLSALSSSAQPGYFTPEDLHRKMQLDSLATSPLQQEIKEINQRGLEDLLKQLGEMAPDVQKIAEKLGIHVPTPSGAPGAGGG